MILYFLVNGNENISKLQHRILLINHRKIAVGEHVFDSG